MDKDRNEQLKEFIRSCGLESLEPIDYELLDRAFRHPSYVSEQNKAPVGNNQRLEFLGDSVVNLLIADHLYRMYPEGLEGDLTRKRSAIVCEAALAMAARKLDLGRLLLLGKGERLSGGSRRESNLADSLEALLGALYLSCGNINQLSEFVVGILSESITQAARGDFGDYKSQLQEIIQRNDLRKLSYQIVGESGPDHDKVFFATVSIDGIIHARGEGRTKQDAEQKAAREALMKLKSED